MTLRVGVFCGGFSGERSVSLRSGKNVAEALRRRGYAVTEIDPAVVPPSQWTVDVAFLALHGPMGEDGGIQAVLQSMKIPFTGSPVSASVLGMNKILTKWILETNQIPTPRYYILSKDVCVPLNLPLPVIIKPINEGSSLGIEIADTPEQYHEISNRLVGTYGLCIVEELIEGVEITASVLDGRDGPTALPLLGLNPSNRFYDYDAKYTEGKTRFELPANVSTDLTLAAQHIAVRAHTIIGCRGASRTDMIIHPTRGPLVLEINTIPGMTDTSDLPAQARCAGIEFDDLVEQILTNALMPESMR
ncbi:D-alanine--D-alanine ligase [bacterium]|nr:D-alanine--D-alanine ligase [bacterium]